MAKIQCVDATRVTSERTNAFSTTMRTTDQLTLVVEYGEAFRVPLVMNALYQPLRAALAQLRGWSSAAATRAGWHHLTAYLDWAGSAAWTAAIQGQTERLVIREVSVDYEQGPSGLWMLGAADFQGTWSASVGVDLVVLQGTTAATLDGTPGLPGFLAPVVDRGGEDQVPLHGLARVGKWLGGRAHLPLIAFDASVALDLERVYGAIAGIFAGDPFTWQEFLEGWEALFHDAMFAVQIGTVTYTLALVSSTQAYQEESRYTAQLHDYFCTQEEDAQLQCKRQTRRHALVSIASRAA